MKQAALFSIVAFASLNLTALADNPLAPAAALRIPLSGAPSITAEPQNQTLICGQSATFTVTTAGDVPLSYQWTFNGVTVGSNSNSYTRSNCQLADNGGRVQVTASNASGLIQSSPATLTVTPTAPNYYVAPNGSSGNTGLSTNSPWPLQYALDHAGASNTIVLLDGLYPAGGGFTLYGPDYITVRALNKWKAVIANSTGNGIVAGGISAEDGDTYLSEHITFDGLCVSNNSGDGIGISMNSTVRNCWVVNNSKVGINTSWQTSSNNIIENCLVELSGHGVWDGTNGHRYHGLYISGPNNIIRNNVVRHNAGWGIHFFTSYDGCWQNNNFIYNNLTYGHTNFYGVIVEGAVDGGSLPGTNYCFGNTILDGLHLVYGTVYVTNNIILPSVVSPSSPILSSGSGPPTVYADYNLSSLALVLAGSHDVVTNYVGFVNTNAGLYWLKSDSPACGKALSTAFGPVNFFGSAQFGVSDIGAFQYNATLTRDIRVLDGSAANPDYWSLP